MDKCEHCGASLGELEATVCDDCIEDARLAGEDWTECTRCATVVD
jgi:uncharacterized protein with PIN domain